MGLVINSLRKELKGAEEDDNEEIAMILGAYFHLGKAIVVATTRVT